MSSFVSLEPCLRTKYQQHFPKADKFTVDQETHPQQSYLHRAFPEYIPLLLTLLPTQLQLYVLCEVLHKPNAEMAAVKS